MKTLAISLFIASVAFAAEPLKQPEPPKAAEKHAPKDSAKLAQYWKLIAAHHAQNSLALQHEAAAEQARKTVVEIDKQLESEKGALCGEGEALDESGPDPSCVAKLAPVPSTAEAKKP